MADEINRSDVSVMVQVFDEEQSQIGEIYLTTESSAIAFHMGIRIGHCEDFEQAIKAIIASENRGRKND